jgi:hypothetical protein
MPDVASIPLIGEVAALLYHDLSAVAFYDFCHIEKLGNAV